MPEFIPLGPVEPRSEVTIREVAKAAGVSIATVSRALNEMRSCKAETRRRVLEVAEELGFRKNLAGSLLGGSRGGRMAASRRLAIGCVFLPMRSTRNQGAEGVRRHLAQTAATSGHLIELAVIHRMEEMPEALRVLAARGCEGLLLVLHDPPRYWEADWGWKRFAVVTLSSDRSDSPFHLVGRAYYHEVRALWERLVKRGYRRIAASLLQHPQHEETDIARLGGILASQSDHPELESIPPLRCVHDQEPELLPEYIEQYRPDVLISFGIRPWWQLQELGHRIPEDIGIVGLHGGGRIMEPAPKTIRFSGYSEDDARIFAAGVHFLDSLVSRGQYGIPRQRQFLELSARWVPGDTLRPVPTAEG